jgi:hypothetical protein
MHCTQARRVPPLACTSAVQGTALETSAALLLRAIPSAPVSSPLPLQDGKCGALGCSQCEAGAIPMFVAGTNQTQDSTVCTENYCDEFTFEHTLPQLTNLWSYPPRCASLDTCTPTQGCTEW